MKNEKQPIINWNPESPDKAAKVSIGCDGLLGANGWTVTRLDEWSIRIKQEGGDTWIVRESDMLFESHIYKFLSLFT